MKPSIEELQNHPTMVQLREKMFDAHLIASNVEGQLTAKNAVINFLAENDWTLIEYLKAFPEYSTKRQRELIDGLKRTF